MLYILCLFILGAGFYSITYGISLWKEDGNKLGGFASIALSVIGTITPIIAMFMLR